jgi:hypothetical protein
MTAFLVSLPHYFSGGKKVLAALDRLPFCPPFGHCPVNSPLLTPYKSASYGFGTAVVFYVPSPTGKSEGKK